MALMQQACQGIVEVCCAVDSCLGILAEAVGLPCKRITELDRFDTQSGVQLALRSVEELPGCDVWVSLPCTPWTTWSFVNQSRLGAAFCARLAYSRRRSLRMVRSASRVVAAAQRRGGQGHFEWPRSCVGWLRRPVRAMCQEHGQFGVVGHGQLPALKPWRVCTSRFNVWLALDGVRCRGDHKHGHLEGRFTGKSAFYPPALCFAVLGGMLLPPAAVAENGCSAVDLLRSHIVLGSDRARLHRLRRWRRDLLCFGPPQPPPVEPQESEAEAPHAPFVDGTAIGRGCVLLRVWLRAVESCDAPFAKYATLFAAGRVPRRCGRLRDLLPMAMVSPDVLVWPARIHTSVRPTLVKAMNHMIAGLNWMHAGGRSCSVPGDPSAVQRRAVDLLFDRLVLAVGTLGESGADARTPDAFLRATGGVGSDRYPLLAASRVDVPLRAGEVDPLPHCDEAAVEVLSDPAELFPIGCSTLPARVDFAGAPWAEYVRLACLQLRAGKVGLARSADASANIFVVGKSGSDKLREVWDGGPLSDLCLAPPKPPWQASPAALAGLESSLDRPLRICARDAAAFFDQLHLPSHLRRMMGRPVVRTEELLTTGLAGDLGFSLQQLEAHCIDSCDLPANGELTPLSLVWPMGFAWSSFVAQSTMLGAVVASGIGHHQLLCEEATLPPLGETAVSIATDDVVAFVRLSDEELAAHPPSPLAPHRRFLGAARDTGEGREEV